VVPPIFNNFCVLAALLHGTPVLGVTEGATYVRQSGHHVEHWPKFLISYSLVEIARASRRRRRSIRTRNRVRLSSGRPTSSRPLSAALASLPATSSPRATPGAITHRNQSAVHAYSGVPRIYSTRAGAQNYVKLFVAHKTTRNNTPNKVRVAATELPQLLSRIQICLERQPHKAAVRLCDATPKLTEKNKLL